MKTINFIRKVAALFCLFLAVNIMPRNEQDDLIDAVVPWLEAERIRVLKRQQEAAY
jgi:hypothetical protein